VDGSIELSTRSRREWRVVMAAEIVSVVGDQLSRVGLSLLVFQRTGSAALTGLTYALALLPDLVAGPLLAPLADRFPRRDVMVVCPLLQAALVTVMIIPGMPFTVLAVAVAGVAVAQSPAKAAQQPLIREILGPRQIVGQGRVTIIQQVGQLASLGGAAMLVATIGPSAALAADAASFLLVAVLLWVGVHPRAAPARCPRDGHASSGNSGTGVVAGLRVLRAEPRLRALTIFVCCVSATAAPAAVIAPLVAELAAPAWVAGPLLAADCLGMIIAVHVLCADATASAADGRTGLRVKLRGLRNVSARMRAMPLLGMLSTVPLLGFAVHPPLAAAMAALLLAGVGSALIPLARTDMMACVPDQVAGTVSGLVRTGLRGGQGLAAATSGALASASGPSVAIAATASVCAAGAATAAVIWRRHVIPAAAASVIGGVS
jgi:MFS family permease